MLAGRDAGGAQQKRKAKSSSRKAPKRTMRGSLPRYEKSARGLFHKKKKGGAAKKPNQRAPIPGKHDDVGGRRNDCRKEEGKRGFTPPMKKRKKKREKRGNPNRRNFGHGRGCRRGVGQLCP